MASAPLTGAEYLESLRDGRRVFVYGEQVPDVTAHPAFRNMARTIARMYDALHDPERRDVLTRPTDTGSGGRTHKFFVPGRSAADLLEARDAIAAWARIGYGFVSRSPDYKASFVAALGANPEFFAPYEDNALRLYQEIQERVWFLNHALGNPPVDRDLPVEQVADVFVRVTGETDAGIVVTGAKTVATGSALTHFNLIAPFASIPIEKEEFAVAFIAPVDSTGLRLICRPSYEMTATVMGSPFDYPLSSRLDENDALLVFEDVLVPWENVLIYRDVKRARMVLPMSGFLHRLALHGCTRFAVKLDFVAGLLLQAVEATGVERFRGVQVSLGEVMAWRNLFWGLSTAMAAAPVRGPHETVLPNLEYGAAYRALAPNVWTLVRQAVQDLVASGLIVLPSSARDWASAELRPLLERYYRGSNGYDAERKVKLMKLLWEAVGTEFAGRQELYERNYAGNHESIRLEVLTRAQAEGRTDALKRFAQRCLDEYDLDGWRGGDYVPQDDVTHFAGPRPLT